jgi:hypothetical protein
MDTPRGVQRVRASSVLRVGIAVLADDIAATAFAGAAAADSTEDYPIPQWDR